MDHPEEHPDDAFYTPAQTPTRCLSPADHLQDSHTSKSNPPVEAVVSKSLTAVSVMEPNVGKESPAEAPTQEVSGASSPENMSSSALAQKVNPDMIDKPSKSMQQKLGDAGLELQSSDSSSTEQAKLTSIMRPMERDPELTVLQAFNDPFITRPDLSKADDKTRIDSLVSPTDQHRSQYLRITSPFVNVQYRQLDQLIGSISKRISKYDFVAIKKAYRAWEICDFSWTPDIIRYTCQDVLTKQWIRKINYIQVASPAFTASERLAPIVQMVSDIDERELEVFEFCAGSGGPTPIFEELINRDRQSKGLPPLQFSISDKYPNFRTWEKYKFRSNSLRAISESVDATNPPPVALSHGSQQRITWP